MTSTIFRKIDTCHLIFEFLAKLVLARLKAEHTPLNGTHPGQLIPEETLVVPIQRESVPIYIRAPSSGDLVKYISIN